MLPHPINGEIGFTPVIRSENVRSDVNTLVISGDEKIEPMWQIERDHINRAVDLCNGNIQKAAALLEVSPSTIYRRIKEIEDF